MNMIVEFTSLTDSIYPVNIANCHLLNQTNPSLKGSKTSTKNSPISKRVTSKLGMSMNGRTVSFLPRHHDSLPSRIPYPCRYNSAYRSHPKSDQKNPMGDFEQNPAHTTWICSPTLSQIGLECTIFNKPFIKLSYPATIHGAKSKSSCNILFIILFFLKIKKKYKN